MSFEKSKFISSEKYRQMLVQDGERRLREWRTKDLRERSMSNKKFIPSERYRQMLVRDGERRYREWHSNYLNYQKKYLKEVKHN